MNPSIGLIISTLNEGIYKTESLFAIPCEEIIVVHQVTDNNEKKYSEFYAARQQSNLRFISMNKKGLSLSRNEGLAAAQTDYSLICDDDGVFESGFIDKLKESIARYPSASIFTFKTKTPDGKPYKKYRDQDYKHTKRSTAKVTSREILIKNDWYKKSNIRFDERFGLGTDIPTGEEYIFLCDAIKQNAEIFFIPEFIVIHPYESSGKDFNDLHILSKGKVFARTYGLTGILVSVFFAVKKYDHYKKQVSFFRFLRLILKGCFQFLRHG